MSRVTMSKDGVPRMTVRVEHRLGHDDLVRNLCLVAAREPDGLEELPINPSPSWVMREVKTVLRMDGSQAADYWQDDMADPDEIEAWARSAVSGAFPDLK